MCFDGQYVCKGFKVATTNDKKYLITLVAIVELPYQLEFAQLNLRCSDFHFSELQIDIVVENECKYRLHLMLPVSEIFYIPSLSHTHTHGHFAERSAAHSGMTQLVVSSGIQCLAQGQFGSDGLP